MSGKSDDADLSGWAGKGLVRITRDYPHPKTVLVGEIVRAGPGWAVLQTDTSRKYIATEKVTDVRSYEPPEGQGREGDDG